MNSRLLSIIIPIFNEEKNIELVLDEMSLFLEKNKINYEIILVNDGSTDRTEIICKNYLKKKNFRLVSHEINKSTVYLYFEISKTC